MPCIIRHTRQTGWTIEISWLTTAVRTGTWPMVIFVVSREPRLTTAPDLEGLGRPWPLVRNAVPSCTLMSRGLERSRPLADLRSGGSRHSQPDLQH